MSKRWIYWIQIAKLRRSGILDPEWYLARNADVATARVDPYVHYLLYGAREGRAPSATAWLAKPGNADFATAAELLGRSPEEQAKALEERRADILDRLADGKLGEMVAKAAKLEPLVLESQNSALAAQIPPYTPHTLALVAAIARLHKLAGGQSSRFVILLRSGGVSGVARIAGHLSHALAAISGAEQIVVLCTDVSETPYPGWFPPGCKLIDFAEHAKSQPASRQQQLLFEFVRSLEPAAIFNMNSKLLWDAMLPFGKALARKTSVYAYLFCNDINGHGHSVGYPNRMVYRYFDTLAGVITDSDFLADDLRERFLIPAASLDKLKVFHTPIEPGSQLVVPDPRPPAKRPRVYWAGRFDRQKRMDILIEVAKRMPEVDFHVWGAPVLDRSFDRLRLPANVSKHAAYRDFDSLPLERCDVWLYTSQWDGVPNLLIEVAAAGIPLVGSLAGGCGSILKEGFCERVEDIDDVDAFVASIRKVLSMPDGGRDRAVRLRDMIVRERSPEQFCHAVSRLLAKVNHV